jgi:hypothetical protein
MAEDVRITCELQECPKPPTYHQMLDDLGMAPVVGTPADIVNAGGYLAEGDLPDAALSIVGILPLGELLKPAGKVGKRLIHAGEGLSEEALRGLDELKGFRKGLGLGEHLGPDSKTLARLDINGESIYGISGHGQQVTLKVNPISRTHAETDVFQQASNKGLGGGRATLTIDHPGGFCGACGASGAVKSMARQLGISELTVVTPGGSFVLYPFE